MPPSGHELVVENHVFLHESPFSSTKSILTSLSLGFTLRRRYTGKKTGSIPEVVCDIRLVPVGAIVRRAILRLPYSPYRHNLGQPLQTIDKGVILLPLGVIDLSAPPWPCSREEAYAFSAIVRCTFPRNRFLIRTVTDTQRANISPSAVIPTPVRRPCIVLR